MNSINSYEDIPFADALFPIRILWNMEKTTDNEDPDIDTAPTTWHEQLEIITCLSGSAVIVCGYRRYVCHEGDIIIINPYEDHVVIPLPPGITYHCCMIDPKMYDGGERDLCGIKYLRPMAERRLVFNNIISANNHARSILKSFFNECREKKSAYEVAAKGYIILLLSELFRNELQQVLKNDKPRENAKNHKQLEGAFRYIAEHYTEKIEFSDLVRTCYVSESYFCKFFLATTGMTTSDYINEFRIAKAEALLITTDLSITEIALQVGFSDSNYFSRVFRNLRGVTPTQARANSKPNSGIMKRSAEQNVGYKNKM